MSIVGSIVAEDIPSDLEVIYQGGDNFLARMKTMSELHSAVKKAYEDLQLGNDAVAAKKAAEDAYAVAADKLAAADKALKDALVAAEAKVAEARETGAQIVADGRATADAMKSEADQLRSAAIEYAAATKRHADDTLADVLAKQADLNRLASQAEALRQQAEDAKSKSEQATAQAEAQRAVYRQRVSQLQAIISQTEP